MAGMEVFNDSDNDIEAGAEVLVVAGWPRPIPVGERLPELETPLLAWAGGRWREATLTNFWNRDDAEWRTHPEGRQIDATHWNHMPPDPT